MLRLEVLDYEGPAAWRWRLTDADGGHFVADHEGRLDTPRGSSRHSPSSIDTCAGARRPIAALLRSQREGEAHVIELIGELDLDDAPRLEEEIKRVEASDVTSIVIDLSQLEFIDSTSIRLLVMAAEHCQEGRLVLLRVPGRFTASSRSPISPTGCRSPTRERRRQRYDGGVPLWSDASAGWPGSVREYR